MDREGGYTWHALSVSVCGVRVKGASASFMHLTYVLTSLLFAIHKPADQSRCMLLDSIARVSFEILALVVAISFPIFTNFLSMLSKLLFVRLTAQRSSALSGFSPLDFRDLCFNFRDSCFDFGNPCFGLGMRNINIPIDAPRHANQDDRINKVFDN